MSDRCPFCQRDPFHYVDIGVGMMPAAVDCCELGDLYFRGARPAPESVTMPWEDFTDIGSALSSARSEIDTLIMALAECRDAVPVELLTSEDLKGRLTDAVAYPQSVPPLVREAFASARSEIARLREALKTASAELDALRPLTSTPWAENVKRGIDSALSPKE